MKAINSIVLLHSILGIIVIGQQMEQGDGRKIIIVLTGQRIEEPVVESKPDTSNFREKKQKKDRWLQHWVKRMLLSKKVVTLLKYFGLCLQFC